MMTIALAERPKEKQLEVPENIASEITALKEEVSLLREKLNTVSADKPLFDSRPTKAVKKNIHL